MKLKDTYITHESDGEQILLDILQHGARGCKGGL